MTWRDEYARAGEQAHTKGVEQGRREEREWAIRIVKVIRADAANDIHDYEAAARKHACDDILAALEED